MKLALRTIERDPREIAAWRTIKGFVVAGAIGYAIILNQSRVAHASDLKVAAKLPATIELLDSKPVKGQNVFGKFIFGGEGPHDKGVALFVDQEKAASGKVSAEGKWKLSTDFMSPGARQLQAKFYDGETELGVTEEIWLELEGKAIEHAPSKAPAAPESHHGEKPHKAKPVATPSKIRKSSDPHSISNRRGYETVETSTESAPHPPKAHNSEDHRKKAPQPKQNSATGSKSGVILTVPKTANRKSVVFVGGRGLAGEQVKIFVGKRYITDAVVGKWGTWRKGLFFKARGMKSIRAFGTKTRQSGFGQIQIR